MIIEFSFVDGSSTHFERDSWLEVFQTVFDRQSKQEQYNRYLKFVEELSFRCGPCTNEREYVRSKCFQDVFRKHLGSYIFLVSIDVNRNIQ